MNKNTNIQFNNIKDFGTLCICAIRYCHGRQTYMPSDVIRIVSGYLEAFSDNDIQVMINDCKYQERANLYGDEYIDKPLWIKWRETLEAEMHRRNSSIS